MTIKLQGRQTGYKRRSLARFLLWALFFIVLIIGLIFVGEILAGGWFLPGSATQFDPVANLPAVQAHAGEDAQLASFIARYVQRDGTMDLTADYDPYAIYTFVRLIGEEPQNPVGVGDPQARPFRRVYVRVAVPFGFIVTRQSSASLAGHFNLGMTRMVSPVIEQTVPDPVLSPPGCSFRSLWDVALENGAIPDAVAVISYDEDGYRFRIEGTDVSLRFDFDCNLVS